MGGWWEVEVVMGKYLRGLVSSAMLEGSLR